MSYKRIKYIKGNPYLYQVHSERHGDKVRQVHEKYIGKYDKIGTTLDIDVVWVKSPKDIPLPEAKDKDFNAITDIKNKIVYAIKNKANILDIEHEKAHITLGHSDKEPATANQSVAEELSAQLMAIKNVSGSKHSRGYFRALIWDMINRYKVKSPQEAINILETNIKKLDSPKEWYEDLNKIKQTLTMFSDKKLELG